MMAPLSRIYETIPPQLFCESATPQLTFRVVETLEELKAATHLVYREYTKRGYIKPNRAERKLSVFHALPETTTFVARHVRRGIIGTISVIEDSPLGLPMDDAYQAELDLLRLNGHHLAEVSMLAFDSAVLRKDAQGLPTLQADQLFLSLQLFKWMFDYINRCTHVTNLVACFNPRHQQLYNFLHLKPVGDLKPYAVVSGNPAVAASLNIEETRRLVEDFPVLKFFYTNPQPAAAFVKRLCLSPEALHELFAHYPSLFASASLNELAYIASCYPPHTLEELFPAFASPALEPSFA